VAGGLHESPGHCCPLQYSSEEFVVFLSDIVANQPRDREIHIIADNLSAHKTPRMRAFLDSHPTVHIHHTPTYSSWLNQVEIWFSKIERDVIARGIFTSINDLCKKIVSYIRHYNKAARPIKWSYRDPSSRITIDSSARGKG
jgi:transposase